MSNIRGSSFDAPSWNPNYAAPLEGPPRGSGSVALKSEAAPIRDQAVPTRDILTDLLRWEGDIHHMYLDRRGLVTVGIGNLIASPGSAQQLPFVDRKTGKAATAAQIAEAFSTVKNQHGGLRAGAYADATTLRLTEDAVRSLAATRLENEFLPGLRRQFPGFDGYPAAAQRALVDMAYNMGVAGVGKFHKLREACEAGDWQTASTECHRRTCRAERNDWTRNLFLDAARVAAGGS